MRIELCDRRHLHITHTALALGGAVMAGGWGYLADAVDFKWILTTGIVLLVLSMVIGVYALRTSRAHRMPR